MSLELLVPKKQKRKKKRKKERKPGAGEQAEGRSLFTEEVCAGSSAGEELETPENRGRPNSSSGSVAKNAKGMGDAHRTSRRRETPNLFMGYIYTVYINIHIYI